MLVNAYLINKMLNSIKSNPTYENVAKSTLRTYIDEIGLVIISIMISIIFTFMSNVQIYSLGMTLFYGIICVAISNLLVLRTMLLARFEK
ncbi:MAG: hypothetical protein HFJ24_05600 [Clostridia bacterium]|nr:hypothetical protein [Clostridia bacterium]